MPGLHDSEGEDEEKEDDGDRQDSEDEEKNRHALQNMPGLADMDNNSTPVNEILLDALHSAAVMF